LLFHHLACSFGFRQLAFSALFSLKASLGNQ
jgi:hypothetical protein